MDGMHSVAGTGFPAGVPPEHLPALLAALIAPLLLRPLLVLARAAARRGSDMTGRFLAAYDAAPPRARLAALLLYVAGAVHFGLIPGHWADERVTALLFLLNGVAFWAASAGLFAPPRRHRLAALLCLCTLLAYAGYVVSGRENPDQVGMAAALLEVTALGLLLAPCRQQGWSAGWLRIAVVLVVTTVLTGTAAWAAELRPAPSGDGSFGMVMQSTPSTATPQQRAAAAQLAAATRASIARYTDVHRALADGYRPSTAPLAPTVHYLNPAYVADGQVLDPARPEALVYANTPRGPLLLGAMYMLPRPGLLGPDPGGPFTRWHVHTNICFGSQAAIVGFLSPFGLCPAGSVNVTTPAMLHVWTIANPGGPFGELDPAFLARLDAR